MGETSFNYGKNKGGGARSLGVDAFIKNRTRAGFEDNRLGVKQLKDEGELTIWLHTKAEIEVVWKHPWRKRVEVEDKKTGRKEWKVFYSPIVSHERPIEVGGELQDAVMLHQRRRKKGERVYPPSDPFGKLCEAVFQEVRAGRLPFTEPLVEFRADRRDECVLYRAADFYGGFDERDLDEEEAEAARAAGVYLKDAWKQSLLASAFYVFCGVNDADPSGGQKVITLPDSVGRRIQKAVEGAIKDFGPVKGDPTKTPYPIKLVYDEDAKAAADKYAARALCGREPSAEVREMITEEEPADTADEVAPYDPDELRAQIEAHAVAPKVLLPLLDACFPPSKGGKKGAVADEKKAPPARVPMYSCDHCDEDEEARTLAATDEACPKCGAQYDLAAEPARLKTRPCLACKAQVPLGAPGVEVKCPSCGVEHLETAGVRGPSAWARVAAPEPKAEEKVVGRRGGSRKKAGDAPAG